MADKMHILCPAIGVAVSRLLRLFFGPVALTLAVLSLLMGLASGPGLG